jgi:hypothetical protein
MMRCLRDSEAWNEHDKVAIRSMIIHSLSAQDISFKQPETNLNIISKYRRPCQKIELEGGRWVNRNSDPVYAKETFCSGELPLLWNYSMADQKVSLGIKKLSSIHGVWLRFAYGEKMEWEDTVKLTEWMWDIFLKNEPKVLKGESRKLCKHLIWLAAQDVRAVLRDGSKAMSHKKVMGLSKKEKTSWDKYWASRWKMICNLCIDLDRQVLLKINETF